jgi:hypothetical protein
MNNRSGFFGPIPPKLAILQTSPQPLPSVTSLPSSSKPLIAILILAAAAFLLGGTHSLHAQVNTEFQITKIVPSMPTTPAITFSGADKASGSAKKWLEIEVWFLWKSRLATDKFSDDLVFNYYVLLANRSQIAPQGTLLSGQVTHTAIPANQSNLKSVMYVSPRALERFFDGKIPSSSESAIVDIGVTISRQGQVVAEKSLKGSGAWWPQFQQTSGFLLDKDATPFAPLYWDYYEPVKKP